MIKEHALLHVIPGREVEFEGAFAQACALISGMPGFRGLSLARSIESPSTYLLEVHWDALEGHTVGFRQSAEYLEWKALLHHFYEPFPTVEHFMQILEA